ncbi:hypothetical protein PTKIN_Ptkin03bG0173000 [Pterospermum kingtungense]
MRPISIANTMKTETTLSPQESTAQPRSPWHSPVPYLFGGLAAMLGLIAFALLILACSYWRLFGRYEENSEGAAAERDVESGEKEFGDSDKQVKVYEEKILVIMAGEEKPTFLATPVSNKASSFGDKNGKSEDKDGREKAERGEKVKEDMGDNHEQLPTITENSENLENQQTQDQNQTSELSS